MTTLIARVHLEFRTFRLLVGLDGGKGGGWFSFSSEFVEFSILDGLVRGKKGKREERRRERNRWSEERVKVKRRGKSGRRN
jgi:hypothetical protein